MAHKHEACCGKTNECQPVDCDQRDAQGHCCGDTSKCSPEVKAELTDCEKKVVSE